jgi:NADH-quinone oxidoreductase subunit L
VGDAGFILGMLLMLSVLGTVKFTDIAPALAAGHFTAETGGFGVLSVMTLLLFVGATGKSAQFPLYVWLPDAMEGPTPVSALIHAATMVTAGVYLIARSNYIFSANHTLQTIVVSVGALTLLMGCIIGAAKDDIKRVLAWSTVSQIGYMFLGVGLGGGAYALAIIHLLAHGFFKANMFLGAGSVMHGMHDEVDIRRFGGLRKYMTWTWVTFMMGWLAIIGIPPLSGFFSKDPIIEAAFARGDWTSWLYGSAALLGAGLTAFYMTRLYVLTFHGPQRYTEQNKHPHESPFIMTVPLMLLALGSIVAGFLLSRHSVIPAWLEPVTGEGEHDPVMPAAVISILTLVLSVGGAGLAWALFRKGTALQEQPAGVVVTAARRNLYTDAFNEAVFERPGVYLTRALVFFDNKGIDGLVNGIAAGLGGSSGRLRRLQTGFVRSYALSMLTGVVLVVGAFLAIQLGWLA